MTSVNITPVETGNVLSGNEGEPQKFWSNRFSVGFHLLLPVAGLGFLILGKKHIFPQLLVQIDKNCISVLCPSLSKRDKLLKWACQRLPTKWSSLSSKTLSGGVADLWSDGSLLCTLINTAIPGACPNPHRHWNQPPTHAQAIAYKYLGVIPTFTEKDLAGKLTSHFERSFIAYLSKIQQSISKITDNTDVERIFCSDYIARGLGLFSGEQHQKTVFYVYPDDFENPEPCENNVIINIKGPYGTFGHATISNIQKKKTEIQPEEDRNTSNSIDGKTSFEFSKMFSWFPKLTKIPKVNKCIEIDVTVEKNRAKVSYIPNNYGMHEINLICNGQLLKGCPFNVHIFDSKAETGDNVDSGDKVGLRHYQKRKIISEMVDLIDEEIPFSQLEEKYNVTENNDTVKSATNLIEIDEDITKDKSKDEFLVHIDDCNIRESTGTNEKVGGRKEENDEDEYNTETERLNDLSKSWELDYNVEIEMPVLDEVDENENLDKRNDKSSFKSEKKINTEIEPVDTQEQVGNLSKSKMVACDDESNRNYSIIRSNEINIANLLDLGEKKNILSQYVNANINKIKIPVKFLQNKENKVVNRIITDAATVRYFPKVYKTMTNIKREESKDINNNNLYTEKIKLTQQSHDKKINGDGVTSQSYKSKEYLKPLVSETSPICPNHIVNEVEYSQISVAEKIKKFAERSNSKRSSKNSSFSGNESVEGSAKSEGHQLSVLNVLDSLKKSVHIPNDGRISLSSTVSLPNISLQSEYYQSNVVKERKDYWEQISMSSSVSARSLSPRNILEKNKINEEERNRLIWKKPEHLEKDNVHTSADDIVSMTENLKYQHSKYCKSVDDCLDEYEILTIDERKKMLLKQNYEEEKLAKERKMLLRKQSVSLQDIRKPKPVLSKNITSISPVIEKIRKFNSVLNVSVPEDDTTTKFKATNENQCSSLKVPESTIDEKIDSNNESLKPEPKIRYRSQFNRAIKYFRKLEEKSHVKSKSKILKKSKQFSLDIRPKNDNKRRRGGSLNISERFSIENLYEDITKNKKGSLKGTPNRTALVEALATFSRKENTSYNSSENEEDIKYDIFKRLGHVKKRKSLKCIFDVYY